MLHLHIMKGFIKKLILLLLYTFSKKRQQDGLLVLCYHRVTDERDLHDPLKVSMTNFEKQISFLKKNYHIISGEKLRDIINENEPMPNRSCMITFDDGWKDNYTHAYSILRKHDVPAVIFVSTDYIGTNNIFWHERLQNYLLNCSENILNLGSIKNLEKWPIEIKDMISGIIKADIKDKQNKINELITALKKYKPDKINELNNELSKIIISGEIKEPLMLSWGQLKEMSQHNIHVGSHTRSHAILTQVSDKKVIEELKESKDILEKKLGRSIFYCSFPNGNYNESIMRVAKETNYLASFACLRGKIFSKDNRYEIKRIMIKEDISTGLDNEYSEIFFKIGLSGIKNYFKNIQIKK